LCFVKTKALLFDFDGLIVDTETPEFQVWQSIYREFGQKLSLEQWGVMVGGFGKGIFDAAAHLARLAGNGIKPDDLRARHRAESDVLTLAQPILPGVTEILKEAREMRLFCAVASSSPHTWVDTHLNRLGLGNAFEVVICSDDVLPGRTKPYPDLFLKALAALEVHAGEALVFEDSPNGVEAAHAAGILVVRVPNPVTENLKSLEADLTIASLAEISLTKLLIQFHKL